MDGWMDRLMGGLGVRGAVDIAQKQGDEIEKDGGHRTTLKLFIVGMGNALPIL